MHVSTCLRIKKPVTTRNNLDRSQAHMMNVLGALKRIKICSLIPATEYPAGKAALNMTTTRRANQFEEHDFEVVAYLEC